MLQLLLAKRTVDKPVSSSNRTRDLVTTTANCVRNIVMLNQLKGSWFQKPHLPTPPVAPATSTFPIPLNRGSLSGSSSGVLVGDSGSGLSTLGAGDAAEVEVLRGFNGGTSGALDADARGVSNARKPSLDCCITPAYVYRSEAQLQAAPVA
jgi:hypothetical protein